MSVKFTFFKPIDTMMEKYFEMQLSQILIYEKRTNLDFRFIKVMDVDPLCQEDYMDGKIVTSATIELF